MRQANAKAQEVAVDLRELAYLTLAEAADFLRLAPQTVRHKMCRRELGRGSTTSSAQRKTFTPTEAVAIGKLIEKLSTEIDGMVRGWTAQTTAGRADGPTQ